MRERETATNHHLAVDQNFLDQLPFAELLENACQQTSILLSDLRRGLIYYAARSYKQNSQSVLKVAVKDFRAALLKKKEKSKQSNFDQGELERLAEVIWKIGQKLDPLALQYIATQWDKGQYCYDGEPKKDQVNFFVVPLTCKAWVIDCLVTQESIRALESGEF